MLALDTSILLLFDGLQPSLFLFHGPELFLLDDLQAGDFDAELLRAQVVLDLLDSDLIGKPGDPDGVILFKRGQCCANFGTDRDVDVLSFSIENLREL